MHQSYLTLRRGNSCEAPLDSARNTAWHKRPRACLPLLSKVCAVKVSLQMALNLCWLSQSVASVQGSHRNATGVSDRKPDTLEHVYVAAPTLSSHAQCMHALVRVSCTQLSKLPCSRCRCRADSVPVHDTVIAASVIAVALPRCQDNNQWRGAIM